MWFHFLRGLRGLRGRGITGMVSLGDGVKGNYKPVIVLIKKKCLHVCAFPVADTQILTQFMKVNRFVLMQSNIAVPPNLVSINKSSHVNAVVVKLLQPCMTGFVLQIYCAFAHDRFFFPSRFCFSDSFEAEKSKR